MDDLTTAQSPESLIARLVELEHLVQHQQTALADQRAEIAALHAAARSAAPVLPPPTRAALLDGAAPRAADATNEPLATTSPTSRGRSRRALLKLGGAAAAAGVAAVALGTHQEAQAVRCSRAR
jgi:hypothetical protein